jgi:lipopolysaccharide biosynthesis regulator YciM
VLIRDALKTHAGCQAAHYYLGELYARDDRAEDAVRAWKAFLEHAPHLAGLIFPRLEKVLFDMGQYSEIAGIYQQVLSADPVNTDALLGLALFSEKKGDDHAALGHLARVLEIDPGHLLARQKMVQIYRAAGRADEAWQAAEGFFTWLPAAPEAVRCRQCGFESREPSWYCRRCLHFDTFDLGTRRSAAEVSAGTV